MKLATNTDDLRVHGKTVPETICSFKDTGFKQLDLNLYDMGKLDSPMMSDNWEKWVDDIKSVASDSKLVFCQAHAPREPSFPWHEKWDLFLASLKRSILVCAILGISDLAIHSLSKSGFPSAENYKDNLDINKNLMIELIPLLEKYNVHILIENSYDANAPDKSQNKRHFVATSADLVSMVDHMGHELIGACWDTGHANIQGLDQYKSIMELGTRLRGVHINDNFGNMDSHIAPFQGTLNVDSVIKGLLDSGYSGCFTFESSNLLKDGNAWPISRNTWSYKDEKILKLMDIPLELKLESVKLLYNIGRYILKSYDCYEY